MIRLVSAGQMKLLLIVIALAALATCDDGSVEDPGLPEPDAGFEVPLPEPPSMAPCPTGWVEMADEDTGVVTCDPWPDGGLEIFSACPEGWRQVTEEGTGLTTCDPWPEDGPEECGDDEAHFPGEPGCSLLGSPCPTGDWAEELPEDAHVIYVRADAPEGGSGTIDSPFGSITEALDVAEEGDVVALSRGEFDELVELRAGVTLWGACVAETRVGSSSPSTDRATVTIQGRGEARINNLSLGGNRPALRVSGSTRVARLEDVLVQEARPQSLIAYQGGTIVARGVVVRGTRPLPGGWGGHGIMVSEGGQLDLNRVVVTDCLEAAIFVTGEGSAATISDSVLRDTRVGSSGLLGRGLEVQNLGQADLTRTVVERSHHDGIFVSGGGAYVCVTDSIIRETIDVGPPYGAGIFSGHGEIEVSRTLIELNQPLGVSSFDEGSDISLSDVVIRDTLPTDAGLFGWGVDIQAGGHVELSRAVITRNRELGVGLFSGSLNLSDSVVSDTLPIDAVGTSGHGLFGRGLNLEGGDLEVSRVLFDGNHHTAIYASGVASSARLDQVVIRNTLPPSVAGDSQGLAIAYGASGEISRALFEDNAGTAVHVSDPEGNAQFTDLVVRDTTGIDGTGGRGINIQDGARVTLERAAILRNREVGVFAGGPDTTLDVTDLVVRDTLERECVDDWCAGAGGGIGVSSIGEAQVTLSRFLVSSSMLCGMQLAMGGYIDDANEPVYYEGGGTIDLHEGEISDNRLCGINVQTEGYDLRRLQDRVLFVNNTRNLDMNELPVPGFGLSE